MTTTANKEATSKLKVEIENEDRKENAFRKKTNMLAQRSKSRLEEWLHDQTIPGPEINQRSVSSLIGSTTSIGPKLKSPRVEQMLTGFYKSSNPNLHNFRRPSGSMPDGLQERDAFISRRQSNQYLRPLSNVGSMSSVSGIIKPLDFSVLKGHTIDRDRAIQS